MVWVKPAHMVVVGRHLPVSSSCRATVELWVNLLCRRRAKQWNKCNSRTVLRERFLLTLVHCTVWCLSAVCTGWIELNDKCSGWAKTSASARGGATATLGPHRPQCAAVHSVRYHFVHSAAPNGPCAAIHQRTSVHGGPTVTATTSPWEFCIPCLTFPLNQVLTE